MNKITLSANGNENIRLDKFLSNHISNLSRTQIKQIILDGFVQVNESLVKPSSILEQSKPKEMYCSMPVINCRAVTANRLDNANVYHCPVYKTKQRTAGTYVFSAQLKTKSPPPRWILAGVGLILDVGI